jgi:hypothetical protein
MAVRNWGEGEERQKQAGAALPDGRSRASAWYPTPLGGPGHLCKICLIPVSVNRSGHPPGSPGVLRT